MGKLGAGDLQGVVANATSLHPQALTRVANELDDTDRLINRGGLGLGDSQLVVVDEHAHPVCGPQLFQQYAGLLNILSSNKIIPPFVGDGNMRGGGASSPLLKQGAFALALGNFV